MTRKTSTTVVTYQHACLPGVEVTLCHACAEGDDHGHGSLGPVQHGAHSGYCQGAHHGETRCECGQATGVRCDGFASSSDAVTVEWMPESLRASHTSGGNRGRYPHNGSLRLTCCRSCADGLVESDPDWTAIVD